MISKVITGHSFYGSLKYVCQEFKKPEILKVEGVREHSLNKMIEDFQNQHALRPEKKQACFHAVLSFYPGEKPSNQILLHAAEKYLEGLNIVNTQYAIVKHTDKAHLHLHIIANMVNNEGRSISDKWIGLRGKKLAQTLTRNYLLKQSTSKNLYLTNFKSLKEPEKIKYILYSAINNSIRSSRSMEELEQKLKVLGIETIYKYRGQSNDRQGVSFKIGDYCLKGSSIDRKFSLKGLENIIAYNIKQSAFLFHPRNNYSSHSEIFKSFLAKIDISNLSFPHKQTSLLELLLREEFQLNQVPYELKQDVKKRRIRKQHRL